MNRLTGTSRAAGDRCVAFAWTGRALAMLMEGAMPNFFTINGKAYAATERIRAAGRRDPDPVHRISHNNLVHPMHIHGGPFTIVETDGVPVPKTAQIGKDTVSVGPGERYDVIWKARRPGKWLLHCHIPHRTTNDNVEEQGGGLTTFIDVALLTLRVSEFGASRADFDVGTGSEAD